MAQGECFECGTDVAVGIYDDPALSGSVVLMCRECSREVPEDTLWDVSRLEAANDEWPDEDTHPNLLAEHPLEEGEDFVIQDRYENEEVYRNYLEASWSGEVPDDLMEDIDMDYSEQRTFELFVRDSDDEEAVAAGREAIREMQSE